MSVLCLVSTGRHVILSYTQLQYSRFSHDVTGAMLVSPIFWELKSIFMQTFSDVFFLLKNMAVDLVSENQELW